MQFTHNESVKLQYVHKTESKFSIFLVAVWNKRGFGSISGDLGEGWNLQVEIYKHQSSRIWSGMWVDFPIITSTFKS